MRAIITLICLLQFGLGVWLLFHGWGQNLYAFLLGMLFLIDLRLHISGRSNITIVERKRIQWQIKDKA